MNRSELSKVVEQFGRNAGVVEGQSKVVRVMDSKTMYVETIDDIGRLIIFNEYVVDGLTYWAGYSARSDTVFVSQTVRG